MFAPGQIVCVKSDPSLTGAVVAVQAGSSEHRILVFCNGETRTFYASQLAPAAVENKATLLSRDTFCATLSALQLLNPGLSTLYSLNAARVDFIPYQFRPVLRFIHSDRPRLLIADGVGVGKTIEAGLILRELQARRDVRSVLIICPRPLVAENKWKNEMKRFEERFTHLDGPSLRYCISEMDKDGVWPENYRRIIIPYSLLDETLLDGAHQSTGKRSSRVLKGLRDLDPPPRFDLVIVDEAHHIRNSRTYAHQAVRFFCDHAEAVVFLTATPVQLGSRDLFVLLNVLRPDLVIDEESFEHMAEPNPHINEAVRHARSPESGWAVRTASALDQAAATPWGQNILCRNPDFIRIQRLLNSGVSEPAQRVALISAIEELHTFSGVINRTRRRDIGDFTLRKPQTVSVPFTSDQQRIHDDLLGLIADILRRHYGDFFVRFLMSTIRRRAASCIHGLAPFLGDILNRRQEAMAIALQEAEDTEPNQGLADSPDCLSPFQDRITALMLQAEAIDPSDPKLHALRAILLEKHGHPKNKVMLFSSFRHTLDYLFRHLSASGFRIGLVHGGTPDEERRTQRERFAMPRDEASALDILLFSEVGCEGLDYQFCDCLVNYDLPWNPMRIEQRIGRIDRNGQTSETVAIVNLITPGTVDAEIYERCLLRIGVFHQSVGDSEEILGEIAEGIRDIAENYALSEADRAEKLQQLADNKIRLLREQEKLEEGELDLFGIRLPKKQIEQEVRDASSVWLAPTALRRLVSLYLRQVCDKDQEFLLGEGPLHTLRLSAEVRAVLLGDFRTLSGKQSAAWHDWECWLKGGNPHLAVTFDPACASREHKAAFIMPLHPLVKQAAQAFDVKRRGFVRLRVASDAAPIGHHPFVIYLWHFQGIREDLVIRPVAGDHKLTEILPGLLEVASDTATSDHLEDPSHDVWEALDGCHHTLWSAARREHCQHTNDLAAYRSESLLKSHAARRALLYEQIRQTEDDRIRRMRQSQLDTAEVDYTDRLHDIKQAAEKADLIATPVAYGVIEFVQPDHNPDNAYREETAP